MTCKADFKKMVLIELVHREMTIPSLAKKIGKSKEAVYAVVNNRRRLPKTKKLICNALSIEDRAEGAK